MRRRERLYHFAKEGKTMSQKSSSMRVPVKHMKHWATAALILNFGVAGIYAQPGPVNMTLSGTAAPSTINLQPGTPASEYNLAGYGTLGQFTLRAVSMSIPSPPPSTCAGPSQLYASAVAGAGVFRYKNGDLLKASLTGGDDCIDLSAQQASCTRIFQITGGTGRFTDASGSVTLTMTTAPALADASGNPVFFTVTGQVKGTVAGAAMNQGPQDGQR